MIGTYGPTSTTEHKLRVGTFPLLFIVVSPNATLQPLHTLPWTWSDHLLSLLTGWFPQQPCPFQPGVQLPLSWSFKMLIQACHLKPLDGFSLPSKFSPSLCSLARRPFTTCSNHTFRSPLGSASPDQGLALPRKHIPVIYSLAWKPAPPRVPPPPLGGLP